MNIIKHGEANLQVFTPSPNGKWDFRNNDQKIYIVPMENVLLFVDEEVEVNVSQQSEGSSTG